MPRINMLDKSIFELIAAGEVVERPASVVKELAENSIDAGATTITAEIKNGGITYIRITDNGCGIYHDDVRKAFTSHATSKVRTAEDLDSIFTLGFRGEALASVAAVSKVQLLTKSPEEELGTCYEISGSQETKYEAAGCPDGTTIVVRDLFYNTPARMKFLKKDVSEANAVADVIDKLALSHPEISFRFIRDGKQTLFTPGDSKLLSAIYSVYGKQFSDTLIETDYELDGVGVKGYVCKPINSRATRAMQIFFLNGRYIKSRSCIASLENAYKNSIMVGKFPACVLNITVPAHSVDVNVHPTKTEVRFSDERKVYGAVYYAVKSALENFDTAPKLDVTKPVLRASQTASQLHMTEEKPAAARATPKRDFWSNIPAAQYSSLEKVSSTKEENPFIQNEQEPDLLSGKVFKKQKSFEKSEQKSILPQDVPAQQENEPEQQTTVKISGEMPKAPLRIIGEAFKTYILCEYDGKLCMIDKHAAHERIIFNRLKKSDITKTKQVLLSPITLALGKKEYDTVISNLDVFEKSGFTVEDFGNGTVIVRECPMFFDASEAQDIILEICQNLISGKTDTAPDKIDVILHTTACKAAIKAGNKNSLQELEKLANEVISDDEVRYCPHGRPVMIEITKYELEKQFHRIQ
ncbi:MAG: DNA mismatch repair endonuclease MutL [Acutalibacteraceae bacterium]